MSGPTERDRRTLAGSFDATAAAYERGRPGYPPAALAFWDERGAFESDHVVLDLAAGTGKLTRQLPERCERHAVEPLARMRAEFESVVDGVEVIDGTAEEIPFADDTVDTVVVAQAFHWFDHDRALTEIARVLRPGGGLGLIWNEDDAHAAPWLRRVVDETRLVAASTLIEDHPAIDILEAHASFDDVETFECRWTFETTIDGVLADIVSRSYVSALPTAERDAVVARSRRTIQSAAVDDHDRVEYPYRTTVLWARGLAG